jgi:hypothetical protein
MNITWDVFASFSASSSSTHFVLCHISASVCSGYIKSLPLVFIFGVATAVYALHRSLPYHVSSKLCNEVFHSQPSTLYLNQVLDKVN